MTRRVGPKQDLPGTILAEGVTVSTDMYETQLNNNVVVFGTPGGGKTEGVVKPNVMQLNSSYVITDPKGNLGASGHVERLQPVCVPAQR